MSTATPTPSLIVGLRLSGKRAAVFGNGQSAVNRAMFALDSGAHVTVYGTDVEKHLSKWIGNGKVNVVETDKYSSADLALFSVIFVVESATVDTQAVAKTAHAIGVPINIAGDGEQSDFVLMPSFRGSSSLQIAVTTNGVAPRVANRLLKEIVSRLPDGLEDQLKEVAHFSQIAREAEEKRDAALSKLDAATSVNTDIQADTSADATAAQTPRSSISSASSTTDEHVFYPSIDLAALRTDALQIEQTANVQTATSYISHALSDLCFIYSAPEQGLGEAVLSWSRRAEKNAYGEWVSALRMQTRQGAGHALLGALSSGSKVSAIASAQSLPYMAQTLNHLVADKKPLVLHVSAQSLDEKADVQSDLSDAFVTLQSDVVFFTSATAQEAHDVSLIAHAVSQATSTPVVHLVNGAAESVEAAKIRAASHSYVSEFINSVTGTDVSTAIDCAFDVFKKMFGRTYVDFEYTGSAAAESVFVAVGNTAQRVQDVLPSLVKEASVGLMSVRVLRPWNLQSFLARLPDSVNRIVVLSDAGDKTVSDPIYNDIATGIIFGRPQSVVRVQALNTYGTSQIVLYNAIRNDLGLEPVSVDEEQPEAGDAETAEQSAEEASAAVAPPSAFVDNVIDISKRLAFPEAFGTTLEARPDEKTFIVKVSSKYRMTPDSYDRNIIHIEFDTRGTDLTYEIGDALGVYGYNSDAHVQQFCDIYGLDPEQHVTAIKEDRVQTRSVRSWLTHALDIFGRPSKKFYVALADFAIDSAEAEKLRWLTTSEGSIEFKDRVADTTTYADLLLEFTSARPSILQLIDLIAPIKPRHYSIASSAKMHPGSVHLCVVTVEWKNSKGEERMGQCTRFLNSLTVGDELVVNVKPSVMKLPPNDSQPVIMAGLGTGMAPFRAFIEERAVRKLQGVDVGPMTLYFGSRHRAMEYLYGEELEAYHADGLLTNLRLAFSRDQKQKIYIQHRMQNDSELLASQMLKQEGCFYLCGPTWPTGDVKDAMVSSFTTFGGVKPSEANKVIEELKEHEKYILEVY